MMSSGSHLPEDFSFHTVEMHTTGHPLRIITSGYPSLEGDTLMDKRRYARDNLDHYRKFLMFEPRGHYDMYGALLVTPDIPKADVAVIFMDNKGYSTMCGHAVISLGRYAIDHGLVSNPTEPETRVGIQCPCGLVEAFVEYQKGQDGGKGKTGAVRFHSVPAFVLETDVRLEAPGLEPFSVDISYGGAIYALVKDSDIGISLKTSSALDISNAANIVTEIIKSTVPITHPAGDDMAFLYGTIVIDGKDRFSEQSTAQTCLFADRQLDRSPCGSGTTSRVALQYHRGQIGLGQVRTFQSRITGATFTGQVLRETSSGTKKAVVVEICGRAFYIGESVFTLEKDDRLGLGFLVK